MTHKILLLLLANIFCTGGLILNRLASRRVATQSTKTPGNEYDEYDVQEWFSKTAAQVRTMVHALRKEKAAAINPVNFAHLFQHADFTNVGGDPKVSNLAGQNFEILQLGTFSFLSVTDDSSNSLLSLHATIERAGSVCGATYIKNITLGGKWVRELNSGSDVQVRAKEGVNKKESLEIAYNDTWQRANHARVFSKIVKPASNYMENLQITDNLKVVFDVDTVTFDIQIDAHRKQCHSINPQECINGKATNDWANFLNVNVKGAQKLEKDGVHVNGLLAYDDHTFASQAPGECTTKLKSKKKFHFNQVEDGNSNIDDLSFLSTVAVYQ